LAALDGNQHQDWRHAQAHDGEPWNTQHSGQFEVQFYIRAGREGLAGVYRSPFRMYNHSLRKSKTYCSLVTGNTGDLSVLRQTENRN